MSASIANLTGIARLLTLNKIYNKSELLEAKMLLVSNSLTACHIGNTLTNQYIHIDTRVLSETNGSNFSVSVWTLLSSIRIFFGFSIYTQSGAEKHILARQNTVSVWVYITYSPISTGLTSRDSLISSVLLIAR